MLSLWTMVKFMSMNCARGIDANIVADDGNDDDEEIKRYWNSKRTPKGEMYKKVE